jgi:hypothetical protein
MVCVGRDLGLFRTNSGSGSSNAGHGYVHHHQHHQQQLQQAPQQQPQSDTSSTGSARDTPPAQRPLPALPVSPPPPQLPPRENRDSSAQRTPRVTNGNAPSTGSVSPWLGGGAPPTTNLDDDWNTDSEPRRRAQRQDITDLSDVMANLRPCECFLVPRSLILAHAHFL